MLLARRGSATGNPCHCPGGPARHYGDKPAQHIALFMPDRDLQIVGARGQQSINARQQCPFPPAIKGTERDRPGILAIGIDVMVQKVDLVVHFNHGLVVIFPNPKVM